MKTYISQIEGRWYAYAGDEENYEVYSIGSDNPEEGMWRAGWTDWGIKYVACPSKSRSGAYQKARRWGTYVGER